MGDVVQIYWQMVAKKYREVLYKTTEIWSAKTVESVLQ